MFLNVLDPLQLPFSVFGSGISKHPILFDSIDCFGTEENLLECPHSSVGNHFCKSSQFPIAVQCKGRVFFSSSFTFINLLYNS